MHRAVTMTVVCLAALAFAASEAPAQTPKPPPRAPRDVSTTTSSQAFDSDLTGLAHVLGSAHYIRVLCAGKSDQTWRDQMHKFLDLEGPPGTPRRQMMVQEFNDSFREQEVRFPACTPEAKQTELDLKAQGARYAAALAARYRN